MQEKIKKQLQHSMFSTIAVEILVMLAFVILYITGDWTGYTLRMVILGLLALATIGFSVILIVNQYRVNKQALESAEKVARASEKVEALMREVVGNITHDLKTPITAIKGYSQGILDGIASTPERMTKYVTTIRNKADDMSGLVDELSFFAQIYQDNMQYDFQMIDVDLYMSDCVSSLSLDLEMKRIDLVYQYLAERNIQVNIDREKLKRVINNIIGNASKYINEEQGIVFVRIEDTETDVIVHIMDNGIGIQKEELPMIFERFYRTDSSRNSSTGGSGLGLAIAKKIIEDHHGKIWADSEPEKGTEISFSLPKYKGLEENH